MTRITCSILLMPLGTLVTVDLADAFGRAPNDPASAASPSTTTAVTTPILLNRSETTKADVGRPLNFRVPSVSLRSDRVAANVDVKARTQRCGADVGPGSVVSRNGHVALSSAV